MPGAPSGAKFSVKGAGAGLALASRWRKGESVDPDGGGVRLDAGFCGVVWKTNVFDDVP
jgi:hypothetical protein